MLLDALVRGIHGVIPRQLLGVYLQGSFALGAADEHSDVDFIVAIRQPLREAEVQGIQALHADIHSLPTAWARVLEGSYVPRDVLRSCARRGEQLWYLDNGARHLIRSTHCNTAVMRHTVREHGILLFGPPPGTLIDAVPWSDVREEVLDTIGAWGREILRGPDRFRSVFYQGFIVLSFCRMWCDLASGDLGSKRRGAAWARRRLDPSWSQLIDRAWATRPDSVRSVRAPADPADFDRTLELVHLVMTEAERERSERSR